MITSRLQPHNQTNFSISHHHHFSISNCHLASLLRPPRPVPEKSPNHHSVASHRNPPAKRSRTHSRTARPEQTQSRGSSRPSAPSRPKLGERHLKDSGKEFNNSGGGGTQGPGGIKSPGRMERDSGGRALFIGGGRLACVRLSPAHRLLLMRARAPILFPSEENVVTPGDEKSGGPGAPNARQPYRIGRATRCVRARRPRERPGRKLR